MHPLTPKLLEDALQAVGALMEDVAVEVLLVGGAAGTPTGVLPATRVTVDCDVILYEPAGAGGRVEQAAETVAAGLGLAARWLNSDVAMRIDALPDGWRRRRVYVGVYGSLTVYAASRVDLMAMKLLAGRVQDREDLQQMRVREDEVPFLRSYLDSLPAKGTHADQIEDARLLLRNLKVFP